MDAGLGYTAPSWVGATLAVSALVLALIATTLERRESAAGTVVAGTVGAGDQRTAVHH